MPQLARQTHQGALDGLRFGIAFGRLCRLAGQYVGLLLLPQAFQHPDLPQAGTDITAVGIKAQRALQIGLALQLLAHAEQQFVAARGQEGRVADQGTDLLQNTADRRAGLELLTAALQLQVAVHIGAVAKGPRVGGQRHRLVAKNAQLGEHELRPVLMQIAEEHQAQAFTQCINGQAQDLLISRGAPCGEGAGFGVGLAELLQQFAFLQRFLLWIASQVFEHFILAQ